MPIYPETIQNFAKRLVGLRGEEEVMASRPRQPVRPQPRRRKRVGMGQHAYQLGRIRAASATDEELIDLLNAEAARLQRLIGRK